jgi:hypothetical protein
VRNCAPEVWSFGPSRNDGEEKAARAALGDGWKPRALLKEEVGDASSFQPTSTQ